MKINTLKKPVSLLIACLLCLFSAAALADTPSAESDGTVINIMETPVASTYSGTIDKLNVREGTYVKKGDTIATLRTTKVYASEAGTVCLFGTVGDSAETLTAHYGAVAYIEPAVRYTVSASTRYANNTEEMKTIHPGETVFLRAGSHVGTGIVTQVSGTSFTIDILDGNFETDDGVYAYRDESYSYSQRIGYGTADRAEYTAYEGSGVIVKYCVANGSQVKKGDVLFETVEGSFAGYGTDLTAIKAPADGVIGSLSVAAGDSVSAGDSVCVLYPDEYMRVEAELDEESLSLMPLGSTVTVSFTYINNGGYSVAGTVEQVSAVGSKDDTGSSEESFYKVIIRLEDTAGISYGMSVSVSNTL